MKTVCLYFQVHQPWRLKKYRFFNMGKDHNYLDDLANGSIMQKVARQCYLPMNALIASLIGEYGDKFKVSFTIDGITIEQLKAHAPEVLASMKELAKTGCGYKYSIPIPSGVAKANGLWDNIVCSALLAGSCKKVVITNDLKK